MQGKLLVFGQFSMIAVLLFAGGWHLPPWAWMLFALGLVVFAAAGFALGIRNFTIMPDPRTGNTLSQRGIYRMVRHPMYTSVLLCGSAVTFGAPSLLRWVALAVCVVVLVLKVRYEEGLLGQRHPEYKQRMAGTYRLVPGIW
ncbi:MAG: hypothetical protein KBA60_04985 [Flavobacteriales bacterium]|nr:hypothetical protein [Flavobacteriales bacterium]MBP6641451.1 hypothetical protein [Flavobacteriales bacterium]MBP7155339.1 hypothetical protein [Flavobacteriales bacterium]HQV74318.1 methyltransferase [Flavobacteriales bacterium]HQW40110.1 methyltransferase [Flavobacteriales bacterium]